MTARIADDNKGVALDPRQAGQQRPRRSRQPQRLRAGLGVCQSRAAGRQIDIREGFNAGDLTGNDPATGAALWRFPWRGANPKVGQPIDLPGDRVLVTASYGAGPGGTQKVGLRFRDVRVPQGVRVIKAVIEFRALSQSSVARRVNIRGEKSTSAAA